MKFFCLKKTSMPTEFLRILSSKNSPQISEPPNSYEYLDNNTPLPVDGIATIPILKSGWVIVGLCNLKSSNFDQSLLHTLTHTRRHIAWVLFCADVGRHLKRLQMSLQVEFCRAVKVTRKPTKCETRCHSSHSDCVYIACYRVFRKRSCMTGHRLAWAS